jgi:hypothetical protein
MKEELKCPLSEEKRGNLKAVHIKILGSPKRREWLIVISCLLIGFALRFYAFDEKSLWLDEVHTFNDSRDDLKGQIKFYRENPTHLHPPLFFIVTHSFYPFPKPERDLRIIPLIFGILSIPMIYFLSKSFSPNIALPCTLSLTFMTYHISLSQEGRSYTMLMFFGMVALYFLMQHFKSSNKRYLGLVALTFTILFYTSYSSIPFIVFSQLFWFYHVDEINQKRSISSFAILNGLVGLFCIPWLIFIALNFKGQPIMDPFHTEGTGSFAVILYRIFNDWVPQVPLMITSAVLLILFPVVAKSKRRPLILLAVLFLPVGGLYTFCKLFNITHFITSRYFINFFPLFLISIYLSIDSVEIKFEKIRRLVRLKTLFVILFVACNLIMLPLYYRSEKQNFKGLVAYLESNLQQGDKIFVGGVGNMPGILHYFGAYPEGRHHRVPYTKFSEKEIEFKKPFISRSRVHTLYASTHCCSRYVADGSRLWIVVGEKNARRLKKSSPYALKGYFDGSFLNYIKFPFDASLYLFLWNPKSPEDKGIDMSIEEE